MNRSYNDRDIKILWGRAAARCAYPCCRIECIKDSTSKDREAVFGKIAHIVAHSDTGPRADPSFPQDKRDKYENLVLLCSNHHDIVDVQDNTFTTNDLNRWKSDHENWVKGSLALEIPSVGFGELEMVTKAILMLASPPVSNFTLTNPEEKMIRNSLSSDINLYLTLGFAKVREVGDFVQHMAMLDADFPERLKAGFVDQYQKFRYEGLEGDGLFEALRSFACGNSPQFKHQAAGLTVLCYLFERCEVFEV